MKQGSHWVEELLVLYQRPDERAGVPGWRPFKEGDSLEEIISDHNLQCQEIVKQNIPSRLLECTKAIRPSLKIAWCELDQVQQSGSLQLGRPTILLLDLDAIQGDVNKLVRFRDALDRQRRIVYLLQVRRSFPGESLLPFFKNASCILSTGKEICEQQSDLESFLAAFRQAHGDSWMGISQNPFDAPCQKGAYTEPYVHPRHGHFINPMSEEGESIRRVYLAYHDRLPVLAAEARDVTMARKLPAEQAINLGRAAAIQELLLALIAEKARHRPVYPVSVEAIRQPLLNVAASQPFELNQIKEFNLVAVHLPHVRLQPTLEECEQLDGLGLAKGAFVAVHHDRPAIWERIKRLEGVVTTETFMAELPDWQVAPGPCEVGLSEICFGVRIEESFSRGIDHGYILE
ncbi:MAG: hypothetical protein AMJ56_09820 [Anaerolineae bacterium SG8_19]|nr:MAG: hypothetical protein AMJ56_09820 [Anaerolineae bacterium SG8_19]